MTFFVCFIGLITSYEDIKEGKIRNKYILIGFIVTLISYLIYWLVGPLYFKSVLMNAGLGLLTGFFFYVAGIWTAADGKLFFIYCSLIPLSIYQIGYIDYFPSFIILINTFIPMFIFLFINLMIKTSWKEKSHVLKNVFKPKFLLLIFLILFPFQWLFPELFRIFGIPQGLSVLMLFMIFATIGMMFYFQERIFELAIILTTFRLIFDFASILSIAFWMSFFKIFILALFLIQFLLTLGVFKYSIKTDIENLKRSDKPSEIIVEKNGKYEKKAVPILFQGLSEIKGNILVKSSQRLTQEKIDELKFLKKQGRLEFEHLLIEESIPFAPFLFLGVLVTYLVHGSVIDFIKFVLVFL